MVRFNVAEGVKKMGCCSVLQPFFEIKLCQLPQLGTCDIEAVLTSFIIDIINESSSGSYFKPVYLPI